MRSLVSGTVGLLFGVFILVGFAMRGGAQGQGAYRAGQYMGLLTGIFFVVGGIYYLVKGIRGSSSSPRQTNARKRRFENKASSGDRSRRLREKDIEENEESERPRKRGARASRNDEEDDLFDDQRSPKKHESTEV